MAAAISITLLIVAGLWVFLGVPAGPNARHMAVHILIMNVLAPAAAIALINRTPLVPPRILWTATGSQLALLAAWHGISPHHGGHADGLLWAAALAAVSTLFWLAVFNSRSRWQPLPALLVTGKIVCLGGALLIFAPATLHHGIDLADQQLAGLLMVTACPLSYLASALVLAVRAIDASGIATAPA